MMYSPGLQVGLDVCVSVYVITSCQMASISPMGSKLRFGVPILFVSYTVPFIGFH